MKGMVPVVGGLANLGSRPMLCCHCYDQQWHLVSLRPGHRFILQIKVNTRRCKIECVPLVRASVRRLMLCVLGMPDPNLAPWKGDLHVQGADFIN
eukprot:1159108-Pelagomonas_calceolata.AAC.1